VPSGEGEADSARSFGDGRRPNRYGVNTALAKVGREAQRVGFRAEDPRHDRTVPAYVELRCPPCGEARRTRASRNVVALRTARSRRDASAIARSTLAWAAAATTGLIPVEKTCDRARFQSQSVSARQPLAKAPAAPNALPRVPTRTSGSTPASAQRPKPRGPRTPSAWASSTINPAPSASQIRRSAPRSGESASMLK